MNIDNAFENLNEAVKNATISFKHFIESYPEEMRED